MIFILTCKIKLKHFEYKYIKKCFHFHTFFTENLPEFDPFDIWDVELLMLGWRGFSIESINEFLQRFRNDALFRKQVQKHYIKARKSVTYQ